MGSKVPTGTLAGKPWASRGTTEDTGTHQMEVELKADTFTTQETTKDEIKYIWRQSNKDTAEKTLIRSKHIKS